MFYDQLRPCIEFADITHPGYYRPLPDDWLLVVSDIEDSTGAIAQGRYKDVNLIGAATITAVLNLTDHRMLPYVFGGDGATLAIPPELLAPVDAALAGLRQTARRHFNLALRVGRIRVSDLREARRDLLVARYQLSPGNSLAAFSGGGAELAEYWIKRQGRGLLPASHPPTEADLRGLSCRWQPLQSNHGVMLSMLVQVRGDRSPQLYRQLIEETAALTRNDGQGNGPVSQNNLSLRWPPAALNSEIAATRGRRSPRLWALRCYGQTLLQYLLDRYNIALGTFSPRRYRQEIQSNSDYRRFDDTLRILFDCSPAQADRLQARLQAYHRQGWLDYGLHRADRALMTCMVFDLAQSEHIHFLDGADGGFAMAARQLKAMRRE